MTSDNAYGAIMADNDEAHWAFGAGFSDPFAGVDRAVPSDVDSSDLASYCLMLGDDALVLAQRLAQWCARAPEIEEDVALANIGLDLLGHARFLLSRAAQVRGDGSDEDSLAYLRDAADFRNVCLVEVDLGPGPGGDFASTIARLLIFSIWRSAVFSRLASSRDPILAGVAAKGTKELAYHRDHAVQWTLRLALGTDYSRARIVAGFAAVWPYYEELFAVDPLETTLADVGVAVVPSDVRRDVDEALGDVLRAAELPVPAVAPAPWHGRHGVHTDELAPLLAEMQSIARAMPGATW